MTLLERIKALLGMDSVTDEDSAVSAVQALVDAARKIREMIDSRWQAEDAARAALPNGIALDALAEAFAEHLAAQVARGATAAEEAAAQLANAQTAAETARTELANAQAAAKAERSGRASLVIDAAISAGRIVLGDRDARIAELVNATQFEEDARRIANLPPIMKTAPIVADAGKRNADLAQGRQRFLQLVNARMTEKTEDYDTAYAAVLKEHGALLNSGKEGSDGK